MIPTRRQIFALSWPLAMNALLLQAILVIDTSLVALLGEEPLAAMGLATSVVGIAVGILFALSNGTQIVLAQAFGAGSEHSIKSGFWCGQAINGLCAFVAIGLLLLTGDRIFNALAATEAMGKLAASYTQIFVLVIFGIAICQNITVYFHASGNSRLPLYSNLLELPLNAFLSYALIHGAAGFPELGLPGAAWGSAAAVCLRAIFLIGCLWGHYRLGWRAAARYEVASTLASRLSQHWRHALPIAATYITMSLSMSVCLMIYARLPVHEFAALTIIFLWVRLAGILSTSWGQATGIFVGQLLGKGEYASLDRLVSNAWRIAFLWAAIVAALNLFSSYGFSRIYPDLGDNTRAVLAALTPMFVLLPVLRASNIMCGHVLRAGGEAGYAFRVHVCAQWLLTVPLSVLFVMYLELSALWVFMLFLLEEIVKALPFHKRIHSGLWKRSFSDSRI